ncbi:MAG: 4-hydroxy-tetrahydrodipicolinate reductase [Spirochaetota bacterium]
MNKTRIAMVGAAGRMGKAIVSILEESEFSCLQAAIERPGSILIGVDSGLHAGLKANKVLITDDHKAGIENSDVVIDFSSSTNLEISIQHCLEFAKPLVIGTTGLQDTQKNAIQQAKEKIAIVHSPNMSIGVNLLFRLTEIAAKALGDSFDVEVLDIHHKHKKDAPSGTAQKLKEVLLNSLQRSEEQVIYGREGDYPDGRIKNEIAVHTMRAGEVIGEHTVFFTSPEERIEIAHKAQDRKTFAVGAVKAAEFVVKQNKGLFDMFDVLAI